MLIAKNLETTSFAAIVDAGLKIRMLVGSGMM
jgi:hypothetical protein